MGEFELTPQCSHIVQQSAQGLRGALSQVSVKDNSARFPISEMIHALRSFDSRECKSQKQNISDTRNNARSAYSRCMRVSTKVQNQKIPSKARGSFLRRSHKKQLISSGNCRFTAVSGGKKADPSLKQNQTAAFWRGGRLRLAMPKMKEQNSRSRKEADGILQEGAKHQNLLLCRPHLQSNTNRRLCQGGNRKYFFDATLSVQSREFFKNFSKIVTKYDTRCHIQCAMMKKKQEEAKR